MLVSIIKKELLAHLVDRRFLGILVLMAILILLTTYVGIGHFVALKDEHNRVIADHRKFLDHNLDGGRVETIRRLGVSWQRP